MRTGPKCVPDNTCVSACAFILLSVDSVDDFMEEMSDTWTDADSMEVCRVKIRHITFVTPADRRRGLEFSDATCDFSRP